MKINYREHLYRNHKAGPYCKRCWKVFENEELLDSHAIVPAASICEAIPGNPPEGITPKQIAELKSKAKPYANQKDTDRWKEIFRLLFPGESVPSPCKLGVEDLVYLKWILIAGRLGAGSRTHAFLAKFSTFSKLRRLYAPRVTSSF